MVSHKQIKETHDFICQKLDPIIHEIELQLNADAEIEQAYRDAQKAENFAKHKDEILSRPKREWHISGKKKEAIKQESKQDLKNVA